MTSTMDEISTAALTGPMASLVAPTLSFFSSNRAVDARTQLSRSHPTTVTGSQSLAVPQRGGADQRLSRSLARPLPRSAGRAQTTHSSSASHISRAAPKAVHSKVSSSAQRSQHSRHSLAQSHRKVDEDIAAHLPATPAYVLPPPLPASDAIWRHRQGTLVMPSYTPDEARQAVRDRVMQTARHLAARQREEEEQAAIKKRQRNTRAVPAGDSDSSEEEDASTIEADVSVEGNESDPRA